MLCFGYEVTCLRAQNLVSLLEILCEKFLCSSVEQLAKLLNAHENEQKLLEFLNALPTRIVLPDGRSVKTSEVFRFHGLEKTDGGSSPSSTSVSVSSFGDPAKNIELKSKYSELPLLFHNDSRNTKQYLPMDAIAVKL